MNTKIDIDVSKIDWKPRREKSIEADKNSMEDSKLQPNMFIQHMNVPRGTRFEYVKEYLRSTSPRFNTNRDKKIKTQNKS